MLIRIDKCSSPNDKDLNWYRNFVGKNITVRAATELVRIPSRFTWNTIYVVKSNDEKYNGKLVLREDATKVQGTRKKVLVKNSRK